MLHSSVLESTVHELELKAGGLFLYATLLAAQLSHNQADKIDFAKLQLLPSGLSEMYEVNFDRLVGHSKDKWQQFVPVIALIVAAREPIPHQLVRQVHSLHTRKDTQTDISVALLRAQRG